MSYPGGARSKACFRLASSELPGQGRKGVVLKKEEALQTEQGIQVQIDNGSRRARGNTQESTAMPRHAPKPTKLQWNRSVILYRR